MPGRRMFQPAVVLVLLLVMGVACLAPLNPDTGYSMIVGRRLLGGDRLYVDIMETNPPLIYWLYAGLAWLGRLLRATDQAMVGGVVAAVIAVSGVCGLAALEDVRSRLLKFALFSGFLVALVVPYTNWIGQREQIASLLVLPYVLLAIARLRGSRPRTAFAILVGVLAGIGFAIKPFYLAAWAAVELVIAAEARRLSVRSENIAVGAVQGVFLLAVAAWTPSYLNRMIPMARAFYGAYGRPYTQIVAEPACWGLLLIASAGVLAAGKRSDEASRATRTFAVVTIGWLIAYVVQGKGWFYQLMPAVAYAGATSALIVVSAIVVRRRSGLGNAASACAILVALLGAFAARHPIADESRELLARMRGEQQGVVAAFGEYLEPASGQPVFFMSTDMWPAFPAVNIAGATWPYHYHFLWPIPALYAAQPGNEIVYRTPNAQLPLEREFFDTVVNDLVREPPRVLVVARSPHLLAMRDRYFDFIAYFSASPEFRDLLAKYRRQEGGNWTIYERMFP